MVLAAGKSLSSDEDIIVKRKGEMEGYNRYLEERTEEQRKNLDNKVERVRRFLEIMELPEKLTRKTKKAFL